jgi:hypothetical protein
MPEKTDSAKGHSPLLDALERLLERVDDEPENAAYLTQKSACELADSLGNQNWWISLCHGGGNVALLVGGEKGKVQQNNYWIGCSRFPVESVQHVFDSPALRCPKGDGYRQRITVDTLQEDPLHFYHESFGICRSQLLLCLHAI